MINEKDTNEKAFNSELEKDLAEFDAQLEKEKLRYDSTDNEPPPIAIEETSKKETSKPNDNPGPPPPPKRERASRKPPSPVNNDDVPIMDTPKASEAKELMDTLKRELSPEINELMSEIEKQEGNPLQEDPELREAVASFMVEMFNGVISEALAAAFRVRGSDISINETKIQTLIKYVKLLLYDTKFKMEHLHILFGGYVLYNYGMNTWQAVKARKEEEMQEALEQNQDVVYE